MNCSPFDKWNRIFQGAIHQTSGQEGGVCEPMWTNRDRGGSAINTRSPQTKTKIAFQSSYLSSTPRPAAYERPDRKCLRFWRLRKIQSGRPWTGGGGVSFKRTILNKGGGSKKSLFVRTSLMDDFQTNMVQENEKWVFNSRFSLQYPWNVKRNWI